MNFNTVFASDTNDLRYQAQDEYYAKRYGYSTYFYEETQYYEPSDWSRSEVNKVKQVKIYQHQSPSGIATIGEWKDSQITPWVDFVPGASISAGSAYSSTFTSSWSVTGGIEVSILKEIVKASASASYEESYSKTYHQEHGIVASYEYAASVLGTNSGFTDYAIIFKQGFGMYKTFNYQGKSVYWYCNIFLSPEENVKEWQYTGIGYFTAPLSGIEYTKYSVIGRKF